MSANVFSIDTNKVKKDADIIHNFVDNLDSLVKNIPSDLGWLSVNASNVMRSLELVKEAYGNMKTSSDKLYGNITTYVSNVTKADTSGSINANG